LKLCGTRNDHLSTLHRLPYLQAVAPKLQLLFAQVLLTALLFIPVLTILRVLLSFVYQMTLSQLRKAEVDLKMGSSYEGRTRNFRKHVNCVVIIIIIIISIIIIVVVINIIIIVIIVTLFVQECFSLCSKVTTVYGLFILFIHLAGCAMFPHLSAPI
jgi:hypothetical protein